jgi:hypothetical protein
MDDPVTPRFAAAAAAEAFDALAFLTTTEQLDLHELTDFVDALHRVAERLPQTLDQLQGVADRLTDAADADQVSLFELTGTQLADAAGAAGAVRMHLATAQGVLSFIALGGCAVATGRAGD